MKPLKLTEVERELIEAGRNYKRSYPNGAAELRYYVEKLFVEWLDEWHEKKEGAKVGTLPKKKYNF